MLKRYLQTIKDSHLRALQEQKGQSLIIFTFALLGLIAMLGIALDLGLVYIEQVRVGRTADAATLAAVVELPQEEEAIKRAIEFIELNGYDVTSANADTEIVVRGCIESLEAIDPTTGNPVAGGGNFSEGGVDVAHGDVITPTNVVTGATLTLYNPPEPRATFMIDTYSFQSSPDGNCEAGNSSKNGDAQKIQVMGRVNVDMNFMQFFGFGEVPVQDVAVAENITNLDIMVVFDISGSMEYETNCYDCWVRTNINDHRYPDNGYFNPLPYNPEWADLNDDGDPTNDGVNQSIPDSTLCTAAVAAPLDDSPGGGKMYLSHEAELYSRNVGNWNLNARTPGQGFWTIQRGSRSDDERDVYNPYHTDPEDDWQGNQAGNPDNQSSSVCNPAAGGIQCELGGDDICDSADGTNATIDDNNPAGFPVDCSAYIKANPYPTYSQDQNNSPNLQGAAYDITCWTADNCWNSNGLIDDTRPNKSQVPYVEYDFTPKWNTGETHIWIRAIGGGQRANEWNGASPDTLSAWQKAVIWEVQNAETGMIIQNVTQNDGSVERATDDEAWRDNRAESGRPGEPSRWKWIKLGNINTTEDVRHTLRLYQGSAGYKVDKIYFTENSNDSQAKSFLTKALWNEKGPPATDGSATREACNRCNPAYGYEVDVGDCSCPINATEAAAGGYGSGGNACTNVNRETSMLENDLYSGLQPIRSAQEAVKEFAKRLDTTFDQIGVIAFTGNTSSDDARGTPLQCQRADPGTCDNNDERFVQVLRAVENQWPQGGTNISAGLEEGLMALGVEDFVQSTCNEDDHTSDCSRSGARKILILMTDGSPNNRARNNCRPGQTDPHTGETIQDMWERADPTGEDPNYECAVHYAKEAANRGVIVYTIGIGAGVNNDFLTVLAEGRDPKFPTGPETTWFSARGGKYFNAASPDDLEAIFTEILGNIYVRIR